MTFIIRVGFLSLLLIFAGSSGTRAQDPIAVAIPLPEHPRPDFERSQWLNLNGAWHFRFDAEDRGVQESWFKGETTFPLTIQVPFSWGAPLSGVPDDAEIGWYSRVLEIPPDWIGQRIFLVIGASDWFTTAWLDGEKLGDHKGGYTPFSFEITALVQPGTPQRLVIRVDDTELPFKLFGKQGYGAAHGIWQTPYLEARGSNPLETVHFTPDIDEEKVTVAVQLLEPAPQDLTLHLAFTTGEAGSHTVDIPEGSVITTFDIAMPDARRWSLEDPFLYDVDVSVGGGDMIEDRVHMYFGMRKVSVVEMPGTDIPYVAVNDKPVYLQLALDQAYHPEGFYTFPSDEYMRNEILRSRQIGLNGMRIHVKVGIPRKLYWADRLGILIMADVPNSWGEPDEDMRGEVEYALSEMIKRDYNHPSIFAWVPFNETWGLFSTVPQAGTDETTREYMPETQKWVASVYRSAKALDPTRLVEDNSVCCGRGHTETDINSWHSYLPGWSWEDELTRISENTYPGSTWNFEDGYTQAGQPNINSEFGNVWGYQGSTGDVDWSWDYHRAVNMFRRFPKIAGWLYTEHHDVVNEWNGYWRFDRTQKYTGMGDLVDGMTLRDLHSPYYIVTGGDLSREVNAGETVEVPLWASFLTDARTDGESLTLQALLYGWDSLGREKTFVETSRVIPFHPWSTEALTPLLVTMPEEPAVAVLSLSLEDAAGNVLGRNFTTFIVKGDPPAKVVLGSGKSTRITRFGVDSYSASHWSMKEWNVLDGKKVNGAGAGFFEYEVPWPAGLNPSSIESATLLFEAGAKQLFGKDRDDATTMGGDYMLGGGTFDPSRNPNAYPMTDETLFPSAVTVRINGLFAGRYELPDDAADHRGILSWHAQIKDRRLREAGSYGQRIQVPIPRGALEEGAAGGEISIRLEVDQALPGGLALYGAQFGRYPLDPSVIFVLTEDGR